MTVQTCSTKLAWMIHRLQTQLELHSKTQRIEKADKTKFNAYISEIQVNFLCDRRKLNTNQSPSAAEEVSEVHCPVTAVEGQTAYMPHGRAAPAVLKQHTA